MTVEVLFRQQFRRDLRSGRFTMEFAQSAQSALQAVNETIEATLILILSGINMPGMTGLDLLPNIKASRPDVPVIILRTSSLSAQPPSAIATPTITPPTASMIRPVSHGRSPVLRANT